MTKHQLKAFYLLIVGTPLITVYLLVDVTIAFLIAVTGVVVEINVAVPSQINTGL